ncbi:hypothetical protein QWJ46_17825 [Rhizobium sp. CBN3]|uniref:hypothetical protein n=1 Tax=Rhizobium sp. CBN3 TaxID=3058045 RepID=UPI0026729538|nr:hypothetical protein [Rhizobium sp. CBN3]MDO3434537.1 hypothetical protein [Rhizobium sp. CBN3]
MRLDDLLPGICHDIAERYLSSCSVDRGIGLVPISQEPEKARRNLAAGQAIGSVRNAAAKGEAFVDVDFNVARLETLLGKGETQKLVQALKDEQKIAQTNAKLFAGSPTALQQAANKLTEVTTPTV